MTTATNTGTVTPKVGDILVSAWGYGQTNICFYQVVKVTPASVRLVKMQNIKTYDKSCGMSGTCIPDRNTDRFGSPFTRRVKVCNIGDSAYHVAICSYERAFPWDGKPEFFSEWN
jgi:hypothetical protein